MLRRFFGSLAKPSISASPELMEARFRTYYFLIRPRDTTAASSDAIRSILLSSNLPGMQICSDIEEKRGQVQWMFRPVTYLLMEQDDKRMISPELLVRWGVDCGAREHRIIESSEKASVLFTFTKDFNGDYSMNELSRQSFYSAKPRIKWKMEGWEPKDDVFGYEEVWQLLSDDGQYGDKVGKLVNQLQSDQNVQALFHNIHSIPVFMRPNDR